MEVSTIPQEERKARIAELYYRSCSVQFGEFKLSAHKDDPTLPLSPFYLHYPKLGKPGSEMLPELYGLVGEEFADMARTLPEAVQSRKVAGVPKGALPLAEATARRLPGYPENLLEFGKVEQEGGKTIFTGPEGLYGVGDELLVVEDHTSGGRNKRLIKAAAERQGLVVQTMLTVVDRMQGGAANMVAVGVDLRAIFTVYELLDYGLAAGFINLSQVEQVKEYIANNQL
jgi:orotate phosphoribosyltransferase